MIQFDVSARQNDLQDKLSLFFRPIINLSDEAVIKSKFWKKK